MSHYDTLGVARDANAATIKLAYRKLAQRYHPDMNQGEASSGAEAMFKEVKEAYETLSDPQRRKRYDETGEDAPAVSLQDEARACALQLFNAALEHDGDATATAKQLLAGHISQKKAERAEFSRKLRRAEKRSGRIKVKSGENLAQMILDQQIGQFTQALTQLDHALEVAKFIEAIMANYEPEVMEPEPRLLPRTRQVVRVAAWGAPDRSRN